MKLVVVVLIWSDSNLMKNDYEHMKLKINNNLKYDRFKITEQR
jgi:hypothetical protein